MNNQAIKEFRERWQAVAAVELEEQRQASIDLRWQQLNSILRLAIGLGLKLPVESDEEVEVVRQRWVKLKAGQP